MENLGRATPCFNPLFFSELKRILLSSCPDCNYFLCPVLNEELFRAQLEALTFSTLDCFEEVNQKHEVLLDTHGKDVEFDIYIEEMDKVFAKYRSEKRQKLLNRSMVSKKQNLVNNFFTKVAKKVKKCPRCETAIPDLKFETMGQTRIYVDR